MTKGPYIIIKIKEGPNFEISSREEFQGPDAIEELIKYLKAKYGIRHEVKSDPGAYLNGR